MTKKYSTDHLTELQKKVTQQAGTETPFANQYFNHFEPGIYVDIVSGEPLFSSVDKFESSSGWPSFSKPINPQAVTFAPDTSHNMVRTEVKSQAAESHLGHVFDLNQAKPDQPGYYCINSAALRFVPVSEMAKQGYGDWLALFDTPAE